jgi:protein-L-isoaspartate(D-aspartate) O-methyltransferase
LHVKEAFDRIDKDYYMLQENGDLLTQTTNPQAIENGLNMLDLQSGQRILEIGTGSGYSTALLATLVGASGKVVSVDIDPTITDRAKQKLSDFNWVSCITGDGREGFGDSAPYDRIIAWTTPNMFPQSWINQIKENAFIVAPFQVLDIPLCTVMVRVKKINGSLEGDLVSEEGYIQMTSEPIENFDLYGPKSQADIVGEGDDPYWVGSNWMKKSEESEKWIKGFLEADPMSSTLNGTGQDIRAYLLALKPEGITFAFRPDDGVWIGYSTPHGFALISHRNPNQWIFSDSQHTEVLQSWWENWENSGKPSYGQVKPILKDSKVELILKGGV